ncbi:NAD(P)-dependent oxidoreductase [Mycobacterium yunnanensis]|uniref:NAD(P)-dependent oxidoreductase n=1 Tax=Mycobacterium yunnanensis TaxID=368477 RepID=A0A9X2Z3X9_9MYCO|nr:NAD(P)-dependent oxidoreductase [Mycobacterium yunnanensis]MCV7423160.1 NAD(P)-dependent oxidoreductase [Mycobacterium yunnanensis]
MTVGFVGAGRMGAPMVRRLVDAGHEVNVLVRNKGKARAIADLGGNPVTDVRSVTAAAEVVVVAVFTDEQVRGVCVDDGLLAAMQPQSCLVLHTTGSPDTARALAARRPDIAVLDAPVSGGPHDVSAGSITVYVGGDDTAVDRLRPLLGAYADPILHVGVTGAGQLVKLVNNTLFAAQIGLVAEAVRLGTHLGVAETSLLDALAHGSSRSRALAMIATAASVDAFIASVGGFVAKDVAVVRNIAADRGTELGILDAAAGVVAPRLTDPR